MDTTVDALNNILGPDRVSHTEADRKLHAKDQSDHPPRMPDVVCWPMSVEEVGAILKLASEHRIPVVAWGAGTSIEGNPIPVRGGILLNFLRMDKIIEVHAEDFQVTVQPGILYRDMNRKLARAGLFFAPDPGANATIGGMLANNAAGIRTVKYGATRDNVLALQVVLANGEIIRTGSRAVKQSAGYNITHLFVGSEGTLGIITEATLKLAPIPAHFSAGMASFNRIDQAAQTVFEIIGSGLNPGALELLDAKSIEIVNADPDLQPLAPLPHLFMEFSGPSETALTGILEMAREICEGNGCVTLKTGMGRQARDRLWETRHRFFETALRLHPGQAYYVTDVAVPISKYPEIVAIAQETVNELALNATILGHAGDGNLHTTVFFPPQDDESRVRANALNDQLVKSALALGGTSTGEHGVGLGKQKYMAAEHGPALQVMRQLKAALDPRNILNPGKVLPE